MTTLKPIPKELLCIIPFFNGSKRHLNLYLKKCDYVVSKFRGDQEQNTYVLHSLTSRLTDEAAALVSERNDVDTYEKLKILLVQHFGDPRSEECLAIELETLKMKQGESYQELCNRIQTVRSILISKVNQTNDLTMASRTEIYNNKALNVFLYNLPENVLRPVRMKNPLTLEKALEYVLEEVNFYEQYTLRSKMLKSQLAPAVTPAITPTINKFNSPTQNLPFQVSGFRPTFAPMAPPRFSFGIPGNMQYKQPTATQFAPQAPMGYRPQLMQPQQFGLQSQNLRPQQFGYRPQINQGQFGYRPQFQQNQFGYRPQLNQFGYNKPPTAKPVDTDISMRTAPPLKPQTATQQGFRLNELELGDGGYGYDWYGDGFENIENVGYFNDIGFETYFEQQMDVCNEQQTEEKAENFSVAASEKTAK